jgi:hypothetical protein
MPDMPNGKPLREARSALQTSPIFALRELAVEQTGQQLYVSGTVSTFYHKQLAQEVVRSVSDGMRVVNRVEVVERDSEGNAASAEEPALANR